jgi:hypothetical protein
LSLFLESHLLSCRFNEESSMLFWLSATPGIGIDPSATRRVGVSVKPILVLWRLKRWRKLKAYLHISVKKVKSLFGKSLNPFCFLLVLAMPFDCMLCICVKAEPLCFLCPNLSYIGSILFLSSLNRVLLFLRFVKLFFELCVNWIESFLC